MAETTEELSDLFEQGEVYVLRMHSRVERSVQDRESRNHRKLVSRTDTEQVRGPYRWTSVSGDKTHNI